MLHVKTYGLGGFLGGKQQQCSRPPYRIEITRLDELIIKKTRSIFNKHMPKRTIFFTPETPQ